MPDTLRPFDAPYLTAEAERDLAIRWRRDGDVAARNELVKSHIRQARSIAYKWRGTGLPIDDIEQAACVGLVMAADRYDPGHAVQARFSTYAVLWIQSCIQELARTQQHAVKLGTTPARKKLFFGLSKYRQAFNEPDAELTAEQCEFIGREVGLPADEVERFAAFVGRADLALDAPVNDGEMTVTHKDQLPDEAEPMEDAVIERIDRDRQIAAMERALSGLNEREADIVRGRYLAEPRLTLDDLSAQHGVSRERIRQIQQAGLRKLRAELMAV